LDIFNYCAITTLRRQQFGTVFDHWLIQRSFVDAILEPTTNATTRLQEEDIPT